MGPWLAVLLGCVLGALGIAPSGGATALACPAAAALAAGLRARPRRVAVAAAIALAASWWGGRAATSGPVVGSPEGTVALEGAVVARSCEPPDTCRLELRDVRAGGVRLEGAVHLVTDGDARWTAPPGRIVALRAELRGERSGANPGWRAPWQARRFHWHGRVRRRCRITTKGHAGLALRARVALRERLTLPGTESTALYRALLLGERGGLEPALYRAFVDSGTIHLLAISGLHMAVLGWGLHRLILAALLRCPRLAQTGRPPAVAAAIVLPLVWGYVAVIAPSEATRRAAVALTVVLVGAALGRRASPARGLAVAAAAVALLAPRAPLGPSFQLSFAAAAALVLGLPWLRPLDRALDEPGRLPSPRWRRPARWLLAALGTSTLTWAATAPLARAWFGELAPEGLLTNLAAVPLVSLGVVPAGFAWMAAAVLCPPLAEVTAAVPAAVGGLLLDLVEGWAELAGSARVGAWPHAVGLLASGGLLLLLAGRWWLAAAAASGAALGLLAAGPPDDALELVVLDVGHGDATLVRTPGDRVVLVDAGGSRMAEAEGSPVARHDVLPALARLGVSRIDLMVVTHADRDHAGGAAAVARRLEVGALWLPPCGLDRPAVREAARTVAAGGGRVRRVHRASSFDWGGARWRVLWPSLQAVDDGGRCRRGRNAASVALRVEHAGRRVLLPADLGRRQERALRRRAGGALRASVLKAGHHGSRDASSGSFVEALEPAVAVVSGPLEGGAMPPHREALRRLADAGASVWITGRDGALRVRLNEAGRIRVRARLGGGGTWQPPGRRALRPP